MNLKRTAEQILCVGVMLIVGLAGDRRRGSDPEKDIPEQRCTGKTNAPASESCPCTCEPYRREPTAAGKDKHTTTNDSESSINATSNRSSG